ncbi:hypothetical protein BHM03_00027979 [Ensete ventricosum]|uniref:Leucine-rich repeat-containing N-terminal plant-type domain-containing protein n=1 Tax=Ensete ventricosum TaxID=4639 RepID=A0A426ZL06_ENSVE|nr:hypothetical protein B296_00031913 [Ensete ventricosum]RZR98592.1 hypothetical protein BHM03_00027979 [Ensete ventricosum]
MAKARGRETLAIGVLLVCILVGNPGGVGGATDQNDGEWFQILSSFFSFLFLERKREPSFLLLFFWVESLSSRIYKFAKLSTKFFCCNVPFAVSTLNVLFTSLNSPSQLTGWIANGGDPCGQSWLGVTCTGSAVTAM